MVNPIVLVNVTQQIAPEPNQLQKRGAIISQGGTTLSTGNYELLTEEADLTDLLSAAKALTSLAWAASYGGQVTATTTVAHGIAINQQFRTTVAGAIPAAYNGTYIATATGASTFTYKLAADPGAETTPGTYTPRNVAELQAAVDTFFGQGSQQAVYVLELGAGEPAAGVTALDTFIDESEQFFYSYLVPHNWDGVSSFLTLLAEFEATDAKTYFFVTTTLQNKSLYTALMKCVVLLVEAPVYRPWAANATTAAAWASGVVTMTTTSAHGVYPGDSFKITGVLADTYNGWKVALPGTTNVTLKYAAADDPGTYTSGGTLVARQYSSAGVPATEFTHAADFRTTVNYNPTTTNKVTPLAYAELFGVTAFPTRGNSALISELAAAAVNYVGTGAEGGISNTILIGGFTMDGRPFNYWYSIDWVQINVDLAVSNAIINGSNNPINPLYYNQPGIDRLEQVVASVGQQAITFGLALGTVRSLGLTQDVFLEQLDAGEFNAQLVINAIPFVPYLTDNPSDYRTGRYAGMSMVYTPLRGFQHIVFNIVATDFVAAA